MVLYLLDADTLIRADRTYYPLKRFPVFWKWLLHNGVAGLVKVPLEQYEEITSGNGELVDWLKEEEAKKGLLLEEEVDDAVVKEVTAKGYAPDLDEAELVTVGRDPFLIAYAVNKDRCVVSFEVSAPSKKRANRKVPDVCNDVGAKCINLFGLIEALDFTTEWTPPDEGGSK